MTLQANHGDVMACADRARSGIVPVGRVSFKHHERIQLYCDVIRGQRETPTHCHAQPHGKSLLLIYFVLNLLYSYNKVCLSYFSFKLILVKRNKLGGNKM